MKPEFMEYVNRLEMPQSLISRVTEIHDIYTDVTSLEFDRIFVTDTVDDDGGRIWVNLWLFAEGNAFEAHDFASTIDIDGGNFDPVYYWNAKSVTYDYKEATEDSRLFLNVVSGGVSGALSASGENCDALRRILSEWVMPRLRG